MFKFFSTLFGLGTKSVALVEVNLDEFMLDAVAKRNKNISKSKIDAKTISEDNKVIDTMWRSYLDVE